VRPTDGATCFLLAKEQFVASWPRGSSKWSAFEGGRHDGESIEETAVREWNEESLGVINDDITAAFLCEKLYALRFTLNVMHNRRHGLEASNRFHIMYAVEIPYSTKCVEAFEMTRTRLLSVKNALDVMCEQRARFPSDFEDVDTADEVTGYITSDGVQVPCEENMCVALRSWDAARNTVTSLLPLPGVVARRSDATQRVVSASVNPDYLEKDQLRWWTIHELETVLSNGGSLEEEYFRSHFLPVLEGMVDYFSYARRCHS